MFNFSQLTVPIIQAPMAGGINTPRLVSAVSNAGGVGSFGFAYSSSQKIREDLSATKALTNGPINANFFVFSPVDLPVEVIQFQAVEALRELPIEGDYLIEIPKSPFFPKIEEQIILIWECCPEILTFHFGIPPVGVIDKAHSLDISVGITATNLDEAKAIQNSGADFIVAQGIDAGGHRGTFNADATDIGLSAIELTKLIAKNCSIPVVSAGGIMNGSDIRKALSAGATAAQLGTAFLCCDEAGTSEAHRNYLLHEQDRKCVFTKGFSGRFARAIENEFIHLMESKTILPFSVQNSMTASLRQLAVKTNNGEYQSLWAGAAYSGVRQMSASKLMQTLLDEIHIKTLQITHFST